MSRLSPLPTNLYRSRSDASVTTSGTTYHSFHDIELYEPRVANAVNNREPSRQEDKFKFKPITRHDSGYESIRSSTCQSSQRHNSTTSTSSSQARPRTRPSMRRATKSSPTPHLRSVQPLHVATLPQQQPTTYYYFPPPESLSGEDEDAHNAEPSYPLPPHTLYWTSDDTRRLEYAAIDAASRGVKGWFMKHIVPDCFVPKSSRRVGFDDTGSVRRYRLELECDEMKENGAHGKKLGWLLGR
ncbi:hypothetical protein F4819DRAFT_53206 [Hypoxylon fuscum]|nr:hypothetical protein F4819DRAFT_53206 [Hypoxylon fuscum]